jgi:hypothetical protein
MLPSFPAGLLSLSIAGESSVIPPSCWPPSSFYGEKPVKLQRFQSEKREIAFQLLVVLSIENKPKDKDSGCAG